MAEKEVTEPDADLQQQDIKFCIQCKQKLISEKKHITCSSCASKVKKFKMLEYKDESSSVRDRFLPIAQKLGMKYCFKCGVKVSKPDESGLVSCNGKKGCGMTFSMKDDDSSSEEGDQSDTKRAENKDFVASKVGAEQSLKQETSVAEHLHNTKNDSNCLESKGLDVSNHGPEVQAVAKSSGIKTENVTNAISGSAVTSSQNSPITAPLADHDPLSGEPVSGAAFSEHDFIFVEDFNCYAEIKFILPDLQSLNWKDLAHELRFEGMDEDEIRRLHQNNYDCMDHLLSLYFCLEECSFIESIHRLATAVSSLGNNNAAQKIRQKASELRESSMGPQKQVTASQDDTSPTMKQTEQWSELWSREDPIGILMHPRPSPTLKGKKLKKMVSGKRKMFGKKKFSTPLNDCLKVKFHAIIPMTAWGWDEDTSVYIRFDHKDLGEWNWDCGYFKTLSVHDSVLPGKSGETFREIEGIFFIPAVIFTNTPTLQYKYVVYSSKAIQDQRENYWEFITHDCVRVPNRCLVVPQTLQKSQEVYSKYDSVIMPNESEEWYRRLAFWKKTNLAKHSEFKFEIAIRVYFYRYLNLFLAKNKNMLQLLRGKELADIAEQLYYSYLGNGSEFYVASPSNINCVVEWVNNVISKLNDRSDITTEQKFVTGAAIAQFFKWFQTKDPLPIDCSKSILKLLEPLIRKAADGHLYSPQISILQEIPNIRSPLELILPKLCKQLINAKEICTEWLFGVVLLHYLSGSIKPFQPVDITLGRGDTLSQKVYACLPLARYRSVVSKSTTFLPPAMIICKNYFQFDQMLIWTFVAICPMEYFVWLLKELPAAAPVVADYVAHAYSIESDKKACLKEKECTIISAILKELAQNSRQLPSSSQYTSIQLQDMALATISLLIHIRHMCTKDHLQVIVKILELLLALTAGMWKLNAQEPPADVETPIYMVGFSGIKQEVSGWLESSIVIGSSRFGKDGSTHLNHEVEIWKEIVSVDCPPALKDFWNTFFISSILEERVDRLTLKPKLRIMKNNRKILPECVIRAISESVLKNIKEGAVEGESSEEIILTLFEPTKLNDTYTELVLGAHLQHKFSDASKVTLKSLLMKWKMWQKYIQAYCKVTPTNDELQAMKISSTKWKQVAKMLHVEFTIQEGQTDDPTKCSADFLAAWLLSSDAIPKSKSYLVSKLNEIGATSTGTVVKQATSVSPVFGSSDAESLCERAIQIFRSICIKIENKTIEIAEMKLLHEAITSQIDKEQCITQEQVIEVLDDIFQQLHQSIINRGPGFLPAEDSLVICLQTRMQEYDWFCLKKSQVSTFAESIKPFSSEATQLDKMVKECRGKRLLMEVCTSTVDSGDKVQFSFPCFPFLDEIDITIHMFYIMSTTHNTKIFTAMWLSKQNAFTEQHDKETESFTLVELVSQVWNPMYTQCEQVILGLQNADMPLQRVREIFGQMDTQDISKEVKELTAGINACRKLKAQEEMCGPPDTSLQKVHLYNQLCDCKDAGRVLNQLRKTLGLTVTEISDSEDTHDISADMELSVINESFLKVELELLKEIAEQPSRRRCIEAFCANYELVKWIKFETKNLGQLQHLVQLITSSGSAEGDDVNDLLADLITVASAFASLIYDQIEANASNEELSIRCKQVWDALEETPKMSLIMDNCGRQLETFKYFSDISAGDIKQSTLAQMEDISANGCYQVGKKDRLPLSSIEKAISITVIGRKAERNVIHLKELQELHGKLVLIGGSRGDNITRFLETLHHVQQIAELLVDLQKSGYSKYIKFTLKFSCATVDLRELEDLNKQMKNDLIKWKRKVQKCRKDYYTLNVFTTEQLLFIREELGALKCGRRTEPTIKLLSLLQCVTKTVDATKISQSLENVTKRDSLITFRPEFQVGEQKSSSKSDQAVLSKQRLGQLSKNQHSLLSSLKEDDFKSGLILQGLSNIHLDTTESPESQVTQWCQDHTQDIFDSQGVKYDTNLYQDQLLNGFITQEYKREMVLQAMHVLHIEEDPLEVLRVWCLENENAYLDEAVDDSSESADEDSADEMLPEPIDDIVKLLIEEEYTVDVATKAVRRCGKNATIDHARSIALGLDMGYVAMEPDDETQSNWILPSRYKGTQFTLKYDPQVEEEYLGMESVGEFLKELSHMDLFPFNTTLTNPRKTKPLEVLRGVPNLVLTDQDNVWKTVLSIYAHDQKSVLPTFEEVVICSSETTVEEVSLLWKRAVMDPDDKRVFSLVHAEKLSFSVCDKVLQHLEAEILGFSDYRIVIICVKESDEWSHVILSRLAPYKRYITLCDDSQLIEFLRRNLSLSESFIDQYEDENFLVRLVVSTRPGMGKSLYIQRLADNVQSFHGDKNYSQAIFCHIPIHGPTVAASTIIPMLPAQKPTEQFLQVLHLDIGHSVMSCADHLLFSIIVLGGLVDKLGNIWRRQDSQLIVIECTLSDVILSETNWMKKASDLNSSETLLSLLPTKYCISPVETLQVYDKKRKQGSNEILMDSCIQKSVHFQRVFQYIRRREANVNLVHFMYQEFQNEGDNKSTLEIILKQLGSKRNPSWSEITHFVTFLSTQLDDCERSVFCMADITADVLPKFKEFVITPMLQMSEEFTAPSLNVAQAGNKGATGGQLEIDYEFSDQHQWLNRVHPYMFFNEDRVSMTFLGFSINNEGHLIDLKTGNVLQKRIVSKQLREGLCKQGVQFSENYEDWDTNEMLKKLVSVIGCKYPDGSFVNPDPTYVLTYDNLMKMVAIHMRFRCNIPVVMMGETGCGKTRLLSYLCDVQAGFYKTRCLICLKVHGGTTREHITSVVEEAQKLANQNKRRNDNIHTVLFFDEVNTTESLELIKEVMCDRRLNGKPICDTLKLAAACNPYRRHSDEMLKKLMAAGLGFYDTTKLETIGSIKPYELVYRVRRLPPSMLPLVYDFGQISGETENKYIQQIVTYYISRIGELSVREGVTKAVCKVLSSCQAFMREQKDDCSFVSLRDVVRALIVFEWFLDKLRSLPVLCAALKEEGPGEQLNQETKALICAVAVCYHARLSDRRKFEEKIVLMFDEPCALPDHNKQQCFLDEIFRYENVFLKTMIKPDDMYIAHNSALRENVFMMVVCIENRLPLFLVGKPGSSKSLAKTMVTNSMQGKQSQSELLRSFKQVQVFPYQCSQYSTSRSIIDVFEEAKKYQSKTQKVSVVVLEEVGLAEASPGLPLKTLHPYLEDGTSGQKHNEMEISREERVAFIGISNWALDPAKMNRGIMVSRIPPDRNELLVTAEGIANSITDVQIRDNLKTFFFETLSKMYKTVCQLSELHTSRLEEKSTLKREFFGLRDFYSLIKMLCFFCIQSNALLTWEQLEHAIRRNFSGMESVDPINCCNMPSLVGAGETTNSEDRWDWDEIKEKCNKDITANRPACTPLGLLEASTKTFINFSEMTKHERSIKDYQENRFLLFITENNSALRILETRLLAGESPFILYGSSFPKDHEYTQVCRNVNQIKIHMETGKPVVLLNLESIYESLYDLLNQCYTVLPRGRYVDLGLRTHRIKCKVHHDFRLIIVAERSKVFSSFPSALINRLEKHFVLSSTILNGEQKELTASITKWAAKFSRAKGYSGDISFNEGDAFIGYQSDTIASVVLHSTELLTSDGNKLSIKEAELLCQHLLLQLASQDALARLKFTELGKDTENFDFTMSKYFEDQKHTSLHQFLKHYIRDQDSPAHCKKECFYQTEKGALLQVTTYGALLTRHAEKSLAGTLKMGEEDIKVLMLQEFDTEMGFSRIVRDFFKKGSSSTQKLLIVQCDNGHQNSDLIACARYRVIDERKKEDILGINHVAFVVQLPRISGGTSFASFQGGQWISAHIDDLKGCENTIAALRFALKKPASAFFRALFSKALPPSAEFDPISLIYRCIHRALSELVSNQFKERVEELVEILLNLVPERSQVKDEDCLSSKFTNIVCEKVCMLLEEKTKNGLVPLPETWAITQAMSLEKLQRSGTLVGALSSALLDAIKEVLVYLLVRMDVNYNLNLLAPESNLSKLWLSVFNNNKLFHLKYSQLSECKASNIVLYHNHRFANQFPFSTEIVSEIDASCATILPQGNRVSSETCKRLRELVRGHAISDVLDATDKDDETELRLKYLNDFLLIKVQGSQTALKLLERAMNFRTKELKGEPTFSLLDEISDIHVAYHMIEPEIYWFIQLFQLFPEFLDRFEQFSDAQCSLLHWNALRIILDELSPAKSSLSNDAERKKWISTILKSKNIVDSTISCIPSSERGREKISDVRRLWLRIQTVHLFLQHIIMSLPRNLPKLDVTPKRFFLVINGKSTTFSDKGVLKAVFIIIKPLAQLYKREKHVLELQCVHCNQRSTIESTLVFPCSSNHLICEGCYDKLPDDERKCPKCDEYKFLVAKPRLPETERKKLQEYQSFQQHCRDFFMEFVSRLCFAPDSPEPPGETFVLKLTEIAVNMGDSMEFEELFPIEEDHLTSEKCKIIRSFLIQLIFEYSPKHAKRMLEEYMEHVKEKVGQQLMRDDLQLYLLCVKSIERTYFKQYCRKNSFPKQITFVSETLEKCHKMLCDLSSVQQHRLNMSMVYMESVAQVRFALSVIADMCNKYFYEPENYVALSYDQKILLDQLTTRAMELCEVAIIKDDLRHFMLKQIIKCHGFTCWQQLSYQFKWIVPHTGNVDTVNKQDITPVSVVDPFALYGDEYLQLRKFFAYSSQNLQECLAEAEVSDGNTPASVAYALYKHFAVKLPKNSTSEEVVLKVLLQMKQAVKDHLIFEDEVKNILLGGYDEQAGPTFLANAHFTPNQLKCQQILVEILVHVVGVIAQQSNSRFLRFLFLSVTDRDIMQNLYLPAMPDTPDYAAIAVLLGGAAWECPNGHNYFIADCGRPWVAQTCPVKGCNATIGGKRHVKEGGNKKLDVKKMETTKLGHILGPPHRRVYSGTQQERQLSGPACLIAKLIMHSTYFWALIGANEETTTAIAKTISPAVEQKKLLTFFWQHMEKDLEILSCEINKNEADTALFVHLVLQHIFTATDVIDGENYSLTSDESRTQWEKMFDQHFVHPLVQTLEKKLIDAQQKLLANNSEEMSAVFRIVSEQDIKEKVDDIHTQLWAYHPRISPEHMLKVLSKQKPGSFEMLRNFLSKESMLEAIKYLPDIVQLLQALEEICNYRLDEEYATKASMAEFSKDLVPVEHKRRGFDSKVESFCKAWNIVRSDLPKGKLPNEYKRMVFSPDIPLVYFIPRIKGPGVCSIELVAYLAKMQNETIQTSWAISDQYGISTRDYNLPLSALQSCHVIDHKDQLEHVILSHCSYSLMAGHGAEIDYNFQAMEKHVLDTFLHGKPNIEAAVIPSISFKGDAVRSKMFQKVRENIAQVPLTQSQKEEIAAELNQPHLLQDAINTVNIALGFLTCTKWTKNGQLSRYVQTVLKMDYHFTPKVEKCCTVGHALSLWKTLNVEQAQRLKDPFPDVASVFKEKLDDDKKAQLNECLMKYNASDFLESLYEFIATYVQTLSESDYLHEIELVEVIDLADVPFKIEGVDNFSDHFQCDILLSKVTDVWEHASRYYQEKSKTKPTAK